MLSQLPKFFKPQPIVKSLQKSSSLTRVNQLALSNYTPYYMTHLSRNFNRKIDDFVEEKKESEDEGTRGTDPDATDEKKAFDPFGDDENAFYNQKKNTIYFFTAATISLAGIYFVM
jgi:protein SCO1